MRKFSVLTFAALALVGSIELAAAQGGAPPCMNDLVPLRDAVQKDGMAVKAAIDKKAERAEICNRLKKFASTEAKFVKFMEDSAGWCGIPPDAIKQIKGNHKRSLGLRDKACSGGGVAGPPPGPGLSDALGTTRGPTLADPAKPGRGTFDTLTGNALAR